MRTILALSLVALVSLPAVAHPHHRSVRRHHAPPATHVVPDDRAALEHARAESELSDLRAGRVGGEEAAPSEAEQHQVWAVQENDAEIPANLRRK